MGYRVQDVLLQRNAEITNELPEYHQDEGSSPGIDWGYVYYHSPEKNGLRKENKVIIGILVTTDSKICCTQQQKLRLLRRIKNLSLNETSDGYIRIQRLIGYFRMQCGNCLNINCQFRDANCSAGEVKKRSEEYKKARKASK